jgi:hypothetical protein
MTAGIVADAVEAAGRVKRAGPHLRAFKHAVSDFMRVLAAVPDDRATALGGDDGRVLQSLGEDVIACLEDRIAEEGATADARLLASWVYEIRRLLEEVNRFSHHYAIARPV